LRATRRNLFKYMEWYEGTGRNDEKVVDSIEKALDMELMRLPELEKMQEKVLKAFPKDL
jgi:pyruvyltransferase